MSSKTQGQPLPLDPHLIDPDLQVHLKKQVYSRSPLSHFWVLIGLVLICLIDVYRWKKDLSL